MTDQTQAAAQSYEFRAEIQQLLNILVHSLYTEREIFLRELISNASDALNRAQFEMLTNKEVLDPDAELGIQISVNKDEKTITVSDTGIGMNRDELIENLGTIAHSGALSFLNALKASKGENVPSSDIIGQFGVGFYSVFMVADRVSVTSRSFRSTEPAYTWNSDGSNSYTIEPSDKTNRGTDVVIYVKDDAGEFLSDYRLQQIVRKHSNYVAFPIKVGDAVANAQQAIWRRSPREISDQDYLDFYKQLTFDPRDPLLRVHQVSDAPVQFYSLMYVPSKLDRGLFAVDHEGGPQLYARKVLIQQHAKDLLPQWMRFVVGVVDSEDLPLNISRETVQSNRVMTKLKSTLSSKLIGEVETLAEKDADNYVSFWTEFGALVKEGVATDASNRDRLMNLLRFHTSKEPNGWVSLKEYVSRMAEGQNEIYYLFGEDEKSIAFSPHLDPFKSRGIEVLLLTETIDSFMINTVHEYDSRHLRNGADSELELPASPSEETAGEALEATPLHTLIEHFKRALGDRVSDVRESKVLNESPARLVGTEKDMGADMERVYRMLGKEYSAPRRTLEINPRHPLIHNLSAMGDNALVDEVAVQLYESALLLEGIHPNPADMVPRIQALMEAATRHQS
ncbi:MAG TPA: molecular chaperone HtpG [Aggregatilineales bacterium]|nr:molecular chaperone HtpG [Aggregatilineales bacterium]